MFIELIAASKSLLLAVFRLMPSDVDSERGTGARGYVNALSISTDDFSLHDDASRSPRISL